MRTKHHEHNGTHGRGVNDIDPALGCAPTKHFQSGHNSHHGKPDELRNLVTVLRHPAERLASGFLHNFHGCVTNQTEKRHGHHDDHVDHPQLKRWAPAMEQLLVEADANPD